LGIILARDNGFGVKGIAPNVRTDVISEYFSNSSLHPDPVDAIAFANDQLHSGDVMLLTLQIFDAAGRILPIERDPEVFEKIKLATRKGIIVVEIAGNGGEDLDAYAGNNGSPNAHIFDRNVRDSGAIMVGSAKSRRPHRRFATSNFGKRVDCYAWGEKIATTTDERDYSFDFGQTSGAGAIIAGAAISVQSMHIAKHNTKLDCDDMRDILSHPSNGTPSQDLIGVMPDLKAIAIKLGAATGS
jgi:microbial collagenase